MAAAGFVCIFGGIGLLVAMVLGAAFLRAAVSVANRVVREPKADPFADWDDEEWEEWKEWEKDERSRRRRVKAIPEPGMGKGMLVSAAVGVLTVLAGYILGALVEAVEPGAFRGDGELAVLVVAALALVLGFAGTTLILTAMLPTTFGRAALVAFLYHVIAVLAVLTIGGAIAGVIYLTGP
jgi:hypothetical protein